MLCVRVRACARRDKLHRTCRSVRPPPSPRTARDHSRAPVLYGRPVQPQPWALTLSNAAASRGLWRPCRPAAPAFCVPSRRAQCGRAGVVHPFTRRRASGTFRVRGCDGWSRCGHPCTGFGVNQTPFGVPLYVFLTQPGEVAAGRVQTRKPWHREAAPPWVARVTPACALCAPSLAEAPPGSRPPSSRGRGGLLCVRTLLSRADHESPATQEQRQPRPSPRREQR